MVKYFQRIWCALRGRDLGRTSGGGKLVNDIASVDFERRVISIFRDAKARRLI